MTKAQLIKLLEPYPDHLDICFINSRSDFTYNSVESVSTKEIGYSEEPGGKILAKDDVIVLNDGMD